MMKGWKRGGHLSLDWCTYTFDTLNVTFGGNHDEWGVARKTSVAGAVYVYIRHTKTCYANAERLTAGTREIT